MLLIVEDDPHYASVLLNLARDHGFKVLVARPARKACALARKYQPTAISLDVFLPDMLGWTVLNQLKQDPRHAAHSGADPHRRGGAPVRPRARRVRVHEQAAHDRGSKRRSTASRSSPQPRVRELLVVEDDPAEQMSIAELIGTTT